MGLASLIKDPPEPSEEEKKAAEAEEQQRVADAQRQADIQSAKEKAALESRLEQVEKMASRKFEERNVAPPTQSEAYQAQQQLGITDEQLETMISEGKGALAVQAIAEQITQNKLQAYNQEVSQVLGNVVKRGWKGEMAALKDHEYYEDLKDELHAYFDDHPEDMMKEGKVEEEFNRLVGKNLSRLRERSEEREASARAEEQRIEQEHPRRRAVEPPIRTASAPPKKKEKEEPLHPVEEELCAIYSGMGFDISPAEFKGIRDGKLLPQKSSVGIQLGKRRSNVEY
jgi:hypothetical protein